MTPRFARAFYGLVRAAGYRAFAFESAESFLRADVHHEVECLVLDLQLPGMSGLLLQRRLAEMNNAVPIVFVTARAPQFREQALAQGAVAILGKLFTDVDLLRAIRSAVSSSDTV